MILADTSVWISHLRNDLPTLRKRLVDGLVLCHPFILGELACGHLHNRLEILSLLRALPQATPADHEEVLRFIHERRLTGKGLGWIDAHLLASAVLSRVPLWTLDRTLAKAAKDLHLSYSH